MGPQGLAREAWPGSARLPREGTPSDCWQGLRSPGRQTAARSAPLRDRKSTRLNSSHVRISYAVFCLKKKKSVGIQTDAEIFFKLTLIIELENHVNTI